MSQPESLRLADAWDQAISTRRHVSIGCEMADELRRLHAENEALKAAVSEAVAEEREACEERVVSLFEVLETPYLPDITRAIRARGTP